jgi:hypothetical protein
MSSRVRLKLLWKAPAADPAACMHKQDGDCAGELPPVLAASAARAIL